MVQSNGKKEDDHDHDHDDHGKKEDDHDDHGHDDHDGHAHGEFDPHIWLDPINAKAMLNEMAEHLIENDPKNEACLLYTSPSPRDGLLSRMPSSA